MRFILLTILLSATGIKGHASDQSRIAFLHEQTYKLLDTDLEAAMDLADSSLQLAQKAGLVWEKANSYYIKGYIYDEQNQLPKAFVMYLRSVAILDNLNDERSVRTQIDVLINCGIILRKYYKFAEAIEVYDKGIALTGKKYLPQHLNLIYNKAYCLRKKGNLQEY